MEIIAWVWTQFQAGTFSHSFKLWGSYSPVFYSLDSFYRNVSQINAKSFLDDLLIILHQKTEKGKTNTDPNPHKKKKIFLIILILLLIIYIYIP